MALIVRPIVAASEAPPSPTLARLLRAVTAPSALSLQTNGYEADVVGHSFYLTILFQQADYIRYLYRSPLLSITAPTPRQMQATAPVASRQLAPMNTVTTGVTTLTTYVKGLEKTWALNPCRLLYVMAVLA